ncbi:MAG: host attachment protein [Pseudomonas sp.]|uniref:host attachment family protein n=1 Tax=Pseudomonas sp. TaxID=306 RepID=UPI001224DA91|nr:host attachment family protein [Pseudomonas sp.]RZI70364.1 MAG: host attachment protein [Pseudomonas sp.]
MKVPHNALVLVADGRKMLLLRNEGDADHLNLQVEQKEIHESPKDRDQKSDAAGRASSTQSGPGSPAIAQGGSMHAQGQGAQFAPSRGSMEETDYHQLEENRFAAEVAEILQLKALNQDFDTLIVAAPSRTLGELRKHYHKEVESRLISEITKDLTNHPVPQIEEILVAA